MTKKQHEQRISYDLAPCLTCDKCKAEEPGKNPRLSEGIRHSKVIRADEGFKYVGEISADKKRNVFDENGSAVHSIEPSTSIFHCTAFPRT